MLGGEFGYNLFTMPLYLVRWSHGRVSLVRAQNEDDLTDLIDGCGSPNDCTWKMYGGPVWIDFNLPGIERANAPHPGPPEAEDFRFESSGNKLPNLVPQVFGDIDTYDEMHDGLMKWAFPNLWKVVDKILDDSCGAAEDLVDAEAKASVSAAIARDEVRHCDRLMEKDVTLGPSCNVIAARNWYLRKTPTGFCKLPVARVERFCHGRAKICPDEDGFVRIALLRSNWSAEAGGHRVLFRGGVRLRASVEGTIDPVHRADAFLSSGDSSALRLFELRRNAGVAWALSDEEWLGLNDFFQRRLRVDAVDSGESEG